MDNRIHLNICSKFIQYIIFIIFFIRSFFSLAQTPAYFQTLQNEEVASNDSLVWNQFGPGMAGYCEEFWIHPTDDKFMYQSPDMYDSYITADEGESWKTLKDYDGTGRPMRRVKDIAFSHQNPEFGLAIDVRGDLLVTNDQGKSWDVKSFETGGMHSQIEVDPNNDNIWYMGAGSFWNVKANHRHKNDLRGYVYTYAEYGHIFKSTDKGETWKKKTSGLPSTLDVVRIIVDPTNSNNVILAANSGIYRSTDKGENWVESNTGLPNNLPKDLSSFYDPSTGEFILYMIEQTVYEPSGSTVKSKGGIYKSTNGGKSWSAITGNLAIDLTQVTNHVTRDKFRKAAAFWMDMSKNAFAASYPVYPNSILPQFNRIVINPNNKNEIYLGHNVKHDKSFGPGDIWKTEDGGATWFACARTGQYWSNGKNAAYWASRNNPTKVNTTFAHLQPDMDRREEIWGNRFLNINSKGHVFICLDQQVLRSTDNGSSWVQIDDIETSPGSDYWVGRGASNLPGRFMLLETGMEGRKLLCSGEHGLWEARKVGGNPIAVKQIEGQINNHAAHSIASVAVHPDNPDIIYTVQFRQDHRDYIRQSTDGGKTWKNLAELYDYPDNDLSGDNIFKYSLMIDPAQPDNMYFCLIGNALQEVSSQRFPADFNNVGVYKSTDGGKSWNTSNGGLPANPSVRRLFMDPKNSSVLYAALNLNKNGNSGGLYKSTNKGTSWTKMNIPATIRAVNNVFVDRNTEYIYISCGTTEGSLNEGGVWVSKNKGVNWEKIFHMPYIWQTETSPVNPDVILVNVPLPHERKSPAPINPGAYLSRDGGKTWTKINKNLGRPDHITDLKPDPEDENVFWCATFGQSWYRGVFGAVESESISFQNLQTNVEQARDITFDLRYTVKEKRDLYLILNSPSGQWLGNGKTTVEAGSGIANITISLSAMPSIGNDYELVALIKEFNGGNTQNVLTINDNINIIEALPDADYTEFINLPGEFLPATSMQFTIYYEATAQRDISLVFTSPSGQYITNTKQTVEAGTGQITLTINPSQAPEPGEGYGIDATIRTVGGSYADNTYNNKELIDIVVITSLLDNRTSTDEMIFPNPSSGKLYLPESSEKWTVYSITGEKILETSEIELDMSGYPKGLYLFRSGAKVQKIHLR